MKTKTTFLLPSILILLLACQFLAPSRTGSVISNCADIVAGVRDIQTGDIPNTLLESGKKQGGEFDANQYFNVLTHLSLKDGYSLDYVYQNDGLGASPVLYVRPADQPAYPSIKDVPANTQLPDFHEYLEVEDTEQGYFEYVVMDIMASQFYLYWHANYNDTQIVCSPQDVDKITTKVNSGDFGNEFNFLQKARIRLLRNVEPAVNLRHNVVDVQVVTFTNWGGFYRQTYTINRTFPHTVVNIKQDILVPYDCGVMF